MDTLKYSKYSILSQHCIDYNYFITISDQNSIYFYCTVLTNCFDNQRGVFAARYNPSVQVRVQLRIKSTFKSLKHTITDLSVILTSSFYKVILLLYTLSEHAVIPLAKQVSSSCKPHRIFGKIAFRIPG